jgi:hypothetical protein
MWQKPELLKQNTLRHYYPQAGMWGVYTKALSLLKLDYFLSLFPGIRLRVSSAKGLSPSHVLIQKGP